MMKEWTTEDATKMDIAATEAKDDLLSLIGGGIMIPGDVFLWHKKWTPTAGHKRLGRIMNLMVEK